MRKDRIEILVIFAAALAVRALIFYPTFIQGGDLGQFTTFVREIHLAGGIPAANQIYFPGTDYIYPPLLFLMVNWINSPFLASFNAAVVMHELLAIAAVASSLTAVLIYWASRSVGDKTKNLIVALIVVFFMPDLYALTWGGDPFILGEFLFVASLYLLSRREAGGYGWVVLSAIALVLLALAHDLTWFFAMLSLLVLLLYDLFRKNYSVIPLELVPFGASLVAGLIWWLPRIKFLYHAFFVTESTGYGLYAPIGPALSYIIIFVPFAVAVAALAFYSLYRSNIKLSKLKWDPFIIALITSMIFVAFILKSETLGSRIMYFTIIFSTIVVLRFFRDSTGPQFRTHSGRNERKGGKSPAMMVILLIVLLTVPFQVSFAASSVNHYKTGYYQYDQQLLDWGQTHFVNGTVVAPNVGNYISSVDGAPVIVYGNFLVGSKQIEYRNAATFIVLNPGNQTSINYIHQYDIKYIVVTSAFMSNVSGNDYFPPALYENVFSDHHYIVEEYIGN